MVKVERLKLNAFRGVPSDLELDFSSPLTLIYAPNGTGKTSVIDGAEWLLTGEVARLNAYSKKFDPNELRCKFALAGSRMEVEGSILRNGEAFRLIRSPEDWLLYRGGESSPRRATRPEVMALLAPEEVGKETDHRVAPKLRCDWIRSARFLTESTLAVLVDADSQNQEARGTALADFLGVSELSARSDKFEKYAKYLNDGYAGEEGLASLKKELTRRTEEFSQLYNESTEGVDVSNDLEKLLSRELIASAKCINLDENFIQQLKTGSIPLALGIGELSAKIGEKKQCLTAKKQVFDKLLQYWPELEKIEASVAHARTDQQSSSEEIPKLTKKIDDAFQIVARLNTSLANEEENIKSIAEKKIALENTIQKVFECIKEYKDMVQNTNVTCLEQIPEFLWSERTIYETKTAVDDISNQFEEHLRDAKQLSNDEEKLKVMKASLLSEEQIKELKRNLEETQRLHSIANERHKAAAGPVEHLRLSTERFMDHFEKQSDCPVCGHSWDTSENLRDAISVTMVAVSQAVAGFGSEVLALEEKLKADNSQLRKFDEDRQAVETFAKQIKSIEQKVRDYKNKFTQITVTLGIPFTTFDDQYLNDKLKYMVHRLSFAKSLVHLRQVLDSGHTLDDKRNWSKIPMDQLLSELLKVLDSSTADITRNILNIKTEKSNTKIDLEKLMYCRAEEIEKLESAHRILSNKLPLLDELEKSWKFLCGESNRSEIKLANIENDIHVDNEKISTSESHLQAANRINDVIARGSKISDLNKVIDVLEKRIKKIEYKKSQAIDAAKIYREKANCYCTEQLDRLFEVAFPMFSRVQANEVFDSIHRGTVDNPFDWIAESLTHTLRPSPHFSMGQRQDLALAIFIARARGLSGTFFLDEPIIHLDDLNRVALLDLFRMLAVESGSHSNFVITTASRSLVKHMAEKFANVSYVNGVPPLRVYELDGNPRVGVKISRNMFIGN